MNNLIISIDGPAGSGKQRIAKYIANKYKLYHLDSGILYRRLAYLAIKNKIGLNDDFFLLKFAKSLNYLSTRNHSSLRTEMVSKASSIIATNSLIRKFINKHQKALVKQMLKYKKGCVIDGRDIGSTVFKDAKIKLFIDVKLEIRAKRRHKQLIELGEKSIYGQILKEIKLRDQKDKNRKNSPLIIPRGAIVIDNSSDFKSTVVTINQILKEI